MAYLVLAEIRDWGYLGNSSRQKTDLRCWSFFQVLPEWKPPLDRTEQWRKEIF
jgi:hypothetical protein